VLLTDNASCHILLTLPLPLHTLAGQLPVTAFHDVYNTAACYCWLLMASQVLVIISIADPTSLLINLMFLECAALLVPDCCTNGALLPRMVVMPVSVSMLQTVLSLLLVASVHALEISHYVLLFLHWCTTKSTAIKSLTKRQPT
jgi:hypothetical protein